MKYGKHNVVFIKISFFSNDFQVDANWLARKKDGGPTTQDVAVLLPSQPLVKLRPLTNNSNNIDSKNSLLRAEVDKETLTTNYSMGINLDMLFGPLFTDHDNYKMERNKRYCDIVDIIGIV